MTEVSGPGVYEKIKVVYSFPSPGVRGAMQDAMAMVESEMKRRGLSCNSDDAYYIEAYDEEVLVWFEYEKPEVSRPGPCDDEAIARDFLEVYRITVEHDTGGTPITMDFKSVGVSGRKGWLAVAQRARELQQEGLL